MTWLSVHRPRPIASPRSRNMYASVLAYACNLGYAGMADASGISEVRGPKTGASSSGTPMMLVTDAGSYSDLIFGIASLLGVDYRPELADLPDQKGWRTGGDSG